MTKLTESATLAADTIRNAGGLLITGGAGMGVDSGLPDFRGNEGFWRTYPALASAGIVFADIANPEHFHTHPHRAWGFYGHRLNLYRRTTPHLGFSLLRAIGEWCPEGYFVFTSNVDGHFQKAGFSGNRIFECHGSINHFQCLDDCEGRFWNAPQEVMTIDERNCLAADPLPRCPHCGGPARPNILMFDDWNWNYARSRRQQARYEAWVESVDKLVTIECGAGTTIPSVRNQGEHLHGNLIRINPKEPHSSKPCAICIRATALEAITEIAYQLSEDVDFPSHALR